MKCRWERQFDSLTGRPLEKPEPCNIDALVGGVFCTTHERYAVRDGRMCDMEPGHFCVWCAKPGMRYRPHGDVSAPPLTLCVLCGEQLRKALDVTRRRHRSTK